jgi:hypothetical protein
MAGGHGGRRPGAGRPVGSRDSVSRLAIRRRDADVFRERVTEYLKTNDTAVFAGDSLELAISIYKNENLPLGLRIHALGLALPFERPRLNAVAMVRKDIDADANPAFGKLFTEIESRLALQPPEMRLKLIEVLRAEPEDGD